MESDSNKRLHFFQIHIDTFCDKWTMIVFLCLYNHGKLRFKELHELMPDISKKVLTDTLRNLVHKNLINREYFPEKPPRTEYSLTEVAKSLIPYYQDITDWVQVHYDREEDCYK